MATAWGSAPALAASVFGVACFNFFFLTPIHTFTVADPQNWVALAAFLITAITAGQLSALAQARAKEAEAGRREVERLYCELQATFERASEAEALRCSEQLKSALLDAVTHDLRTPLTSIKSSATTLLDRSLALDEEGRREMLEVIDEEADRLNRFVESLVELARIEAGEMRLRRRWGAAEEIVTIAIERAAPLTARHSVEVELEDELPAVRVDAGALAEVVYTLLDNAAKYSPPAILIRVAAARGGGETIRLSVEDEGAGVAPEMRERVFDKFFRATADGAKGAPGPSGLGMCLAIARGIVEAHGGRVWSEAGARVRAALRRAPPATNRASDLIEVGDFRASLSARSVTVKGRELHRADRIPARLHRPAAQEDRTEPGQAAVHPDRTLGRLPLQPRRVKPSPRRSPPLRTFYEPLTRPLRVGA